MVHWVVLGGMLILGQSLVECRVASLVILGNKFKNSCSIFAS